VVEERHGKVSLFPHTEQLPKLLRALNLEFYSALPDRIARVDKRADGFHKVMLKRAAMFYCGGFNRGRKDNLRLMAFQDADLVTKVALVQQIAEDRPLGKMHRFRFYGRDGFFPDIHLSGKRLVFADHVLQRFSSRVPNNVGDDLSNFLWVFFGCVFVAMPVGKSRAFILPYFDSVLAFTYTEADGEFFVTTCLTVNEMNSLKLEMPPQVFNMHFGKDFTRPRIRNWFLTGIAGDLYEKFEKKIQPVPPPWENRFKNWKHLAQYVKDSALKDGHGPGSRLCFLDNIPGPMTLEVKPDEKEGVFDEVEAYKKLYPDHDWEAIFAETAAQKSRPPKEYVKNRPST
jgi:hypothetical protein